MQGLNGVGGGSNPRLGASPRPQSHHVGMTSTGPISLPPPGWPGPIYPHSDPPRAGSDGSQVA